MREMSVPFRVWFQESRCKRLLLVSAGVVAIGLFSLRNCSAQGVVPSSRSTCNSTHAGTFSSNVTISAGQVCHFIGGGIVGNVMLTGGTLSLSNAIVRGNVLVNGGGTLIVTNSTIGGNVEINGGGTFSIGPSTSINGNLQIHNLPVGPKRNQICGAAVSGNLQLQNNGAAVQIGAASRCAGDTIGGNLQVQNNSASTMVFNNTIGRNTEDQNNTAPTLVVGNTVGGNLQVQNNNAPVTVSFNNVQRNLLCENNPLISGGSNTAGQNQGCPNTLQATAFAVSNGSSVVFKSPAGTTVLTIPLVNQEVVTPTPQGDVTNVTQQRANISDDGSHAGIYTETVVVGLADEGTEGFVTGTFAYYDASGQLWQIGAPLGDAFYLPGGEGLRAVTPDGSRVLIISAEDGNINPSFTVYDQTGQVLYQPAGSFLGLYQAQISPNGRYLLIMGVIQSNQTQQDLIRVTDLTTTLSSDLPINIASAGIPVISISSDDRFLISYQGTQTVLPSQ